MTKVLITTEIDVDSLLFSSDNEAFDLIKSVDDNMGTIEFTRRIYDYARDLLIAEGETL